MRIYENVSGRTQIEPEDDGYGHKFIIHHRGVEKICYTEEYFRKHLKN